MERDDRRETTRPVPADRPGTPGARRERALVRWYAAMVDPLAGHARTVALQLLAPRAGERILAVGCGTGSVLPELARAVGSSGRVIGVDASPASAALAADRVRRAAMADICRVIAADPPPIPAPDGWADALIISFMLGSVDTARRAGLLDDCRRVLSIGGRMVCVTVSDRDAGSYATRMYGALHRHAPGIAGSEPIAAASLAAAAGFTLTDRLGLRLWRLQVDVIRAVT